MTIRKLQLRRGTDAERAGVTFAEGELVYATDTDELWIGDGSTAGGIGPFRRQATVDHGGLAGLGDDDHTIYVLKDGSRTMDALTVAGTVTLAGAVNQIVAASPLLAVWNTTETNSDGGRAGSLIFVGETAAGSPHYMATLVGAHDGSSADEKGKVTLSLNDGNDVVAPSVAYVFAIDDFEIPGTVDGRDLATDGAKLDTIGMLHHVGKSATQNLSTSYANVTWTRTAVFADTGINLVGSSDEFEIDGWSGRLIVHVDLTAQNTSSSNTTDWIFKLARDDGGGYADVPNSSRVGVAVNNVHWQSLHATVAIDVADGDLIKVQCKTQTGGGNVRLVTEGCAITLQRVPAP